MSSKKILIVEDEVLIREMLKEIFLTEFEEVLTAGNGIQGIERFSRYQPDLIITDIKMRKMDGLTMIESIQKHKPAQKFIIITAYSDEHHQKEAARLGVSNLFIKPVDSRELIEKAKELLA